MKVNIGIFMIGKTQVNQEAVARWLNFMGVQDFAVPDNVTEPALLIALAGKRCYKSFDESQNPNITRIRKDWAEYIDNILASGHGSVLEHSVYTFALENVSRVFTAEMNRHRAGWAISEGSMRFIRFGEDVPYWEPQSIQGPPKLDSEQAKAFRSEQPTAILALLQNPTFISTAEERRDASRIVFERCFRDAQAWYRVLEALWAAELAPTSKFRSKKEITSMMRRIIPIGVATGGVWTGNIRALRHVITMRADPAAEEEILTVFSRIAQMMAEAEPLLFGDFHQDDNGFWRPKYKKV